MELSHHLLVDTVQPQAGIPVVPFKERRNILRRGAEKPILVLFEYPLVNLQLPLVLVKPGVALPPRKRLSEDIGKGLSTLHLPLQILEDAWQLLHNLLWTFLDHEILEVPQRHLALNVIDLSLELCELSQKAVDGLLLQCDPSC